MSRSIRKAVMTVAALAAMALGGAALADAAQNNGSSSSGSSGSATPQAQPAGAPQGAPQGMPPRPHVGANGKQEEPLTGDTADKVRKAALDKVPGGTVERVETDVDHGSPYEAHVRKSDGTEVEVLVNESFEVTAVNEMRHP